MNGQEMDNLFKDFEPAQRYESHAKSKMSKISDFAEVTPLGKYMVKQAFIMLTLKIWVVVIAV